MDEGRKADVAEIEKAKRTAPDKETLICAEKASKVIKDEMGSGYLKDQRRALVKAAKSGRKGNIQDVQTRITKQNEKNMGHGRSSFFISLPNHLR